MILGGDFHADPEPRARTRLHSDSAPGPLDDDTTASRSAENSASHRYSVPPTSMSVPLLSSAALPSDSKTGEALASRMPIPPLQHLLDMGFDEQRAFQALRASSSLHDAMNLLSRQVTSQPSRYHAAIGGPLPQPCAPHVHHSLHNAPAPHPKPHPHSNAHHSPHSAPCPHPKPHPHSNAHHNPHSAPAPHLNPHLHVVPPLSLSISPEVGRKAALCQHPGGPQLEGGQAHNQTDEQKAIQQSASGGSLLLSDCPAPPLPPRMTPTPTEVVPSFVHSRPGIVMRTARSREVPKIHCSSALPLSSEALSLLPDNLYFNSHAPYGPFPALSHVCSPASGTRARSEPPGGPPLPGPCPRSCSQQNGFGTHAACPPPLPPKASAVPPEESPPALPPRRSQVLTEPAPKTSCASTSASASAIPSPGAISSGGRFRVVRPVNAQQFRLFMEQHVENVFRQQQEREQRKNRLESEMNIAGLSTGAQEQMRRLLTLKESNYMRMRRRKMERSMFTKLKVLGAGAFGEVALVRKIDNRQLYAMKKLKKSKVLEHKQAAHVQAERDILAEADNEWMVKLYYSFQDEKHLYFVMEYIPGGDMMSLLIKKEIFSDRMAQFYIAELCLSLQSVHALGFVHRDVKPDNILICRDGHIKLTDFGLCTGFRWQHMSKYYSQNYNPQDSLVAETSKSPRAPSKKLLEARRARDKERRKAYSLVGTPNYIAPEILQRAPYTKACDWWSVGVILYEMLVGRPPFLANRAPETQYKVIHWQKYLHVPSNLRPEAQDLIRSFCRDQEDRLTDPDEIKRHTFFKGIEWDRVRQSPSPYVPQIADELDTSNFDPVDEDPSSEEEEEDACGGILAVGPPELERLALNSTDEETPRHVFCDFTFRRFFDRENYP